MCASYYNKVGVTDAANSPAPMMYGGVVGRLEEFNSKNDSVAAWVERTTLYMDTNNIPTQVERLPF